MIDCALQAGRQSHVRDIIQEYREHWSREGQAWMYFLFAAAAAALVLVLIVS